MNEERIREEIAIRLHTTERTILKMTCERSVLNTSWEELPEKWREKFRGNAEQILSIKGIRLEADNQDKPQNPYHPNPLREYDHQITEAGMVGYGEAQLDMLKEGWVKCKVKEEQHGL